MPAEPAAPSDLLTELGFYVLAGHASSPRTALDEARDGERLGLGSAFVSERFNVKDAPTLCGAVGAVTERIGIATAATNHNTRHPLVTATFGATMHAMTGGRFALGLGRGFDALFDVMGVPRVTAAQLTDTIDILRRLWAGESVIGHEGPAGSFPFLHQGAGLDGAPPVLLVALGPRTLELAGAVADGVVLHTFFSDQALVDAVASVRRGAEQAGRDPASVRVWSVLATVGDHLGEEQQLRKLVGRMATYLQGYGDLLVRVNGWDPAALARVRAHPVFTGSHGRSRRHGLGRRAPGPVRGPARRVARRRGAGHGRAVRGHGAGPVRPGGGLGDPPRGHPVRAGPGGGGLPAGPAVGPGRAVRRQPRSLRRLSALRAGSLGRAGTISHHHPLHRGADDVIRLVATGVIALLANAIALVVGPQLLDDMSLDGVAFVIAVLIYTGVAVLAEPLIRQMALKNVPALLGSSSLVATLVSLVVTALVSDGLQISGGTTWVLATVVVWAVALAARLLLPLVLFKKALANAREQQRLTQRAVAAAPSAGPSLQ